MRLRYPGMIEVDGLVWRYAVQSFGRAYRLVYGDFDRDALWLAPWSIAWLYRWLPHTIAWLGDAEHRKGDPWAGFRFAAIAARWQFVWPLSWRRARGLGAGFTLSHGPRP